MLSERKVHNGVGAFRGLWGVVRSLHDVGRFAPQPSLVRGRRRVETVPGDKGVLCVRGQSFFKSPTTGGSGRLATLP